MNKYTSFVIAGMLFFTASCASLTKDIKVSSESDPKVSMSGYKTYAWLASAQLLYDPEGKWEPRHVDMDNEIKFLIDQELQKRNINQTNDYPDMIIGYAAGVDMTALGLVKNPDMQKELLQNVPKAALALVVVDAKTGYLIWVGAAEANVLEQPSNDVVRKRLKYAVKKMFKLMPK